MNKIKTFISGYKFLLGCVWHASKAYVILNLISNLVAVPVALIASVSVAQKVIDRVLAGVRFYPCSALLRFTSPCSSSPRSYKTASGCFTPSGR